MKIIPVECQNAKCKRRKKLTVQYPVLKLAWLVNIRQIVLANSGSMFVNLV